LFIVGAVGVLAYFFFTREIPGVRDVIPAPNLSYYLIPVIIIIVATYVVACCFFNVYNVGVDTLFLCFLEDLERNDGSAEKPYYMNSDLMKILGKKNNPSTSLTNK
jgi:choline transporter-like protein 2/4/5